MRIRTTDDLKKTLDLRGKVVFMRIDGNVPVVNGKVTDDFRFILVKDDINELADEGAIVVVFTHLGRPKGVEEKYSLKQVCDHFAKVLGRDITFIEDCIGPKVEETIAKAKNGSVLLLENIRFHDGEKQNDPEFAEEFIRPADAYVYNAFSCAQNEETSSDAVGYFIDTYAGRSMLKEIEKLKSILDKPQKPFLSISGGKKISEKIELLKNLSDDDIIALGGMSHTLCVALGFNSLTTENSLLELNKIAEAKELLTSMQKKHSTLFLPEDFAVAERFDLNAKYVLAPYEKWFGNDSPKEEEKKKTENIVYYDYFGREDLPEKGEIMDIGINSAYFLASQLKNYKTVIWNGPGGVYEIPEFLTGTKIIAEEIARLTKEGKIISICGGGDINSAVKDAGFIDEFSYVCGGGGAFLAWLQRKKMPGLELCVTGEGSLYMRESQFEC